MELTKELKEKVEKAKSVEEAKKIIEEAGIKLTEEELDQVAGGLPRRITKVSQKASASPLREQSTETDNMQLTGELL